MENAMRILREGFGPSSDGMLGPGVYLSRSEKKASCYPRYDGGEQLAILKVYYYPGRRKYIMYHGTTMRRALRIQREGFRCSSKGMLGPGVYLSRDIEKASRYPKDDRGQQRAIIKVEVRVGKVKRIDYQGHPLQKTWYQHGYDTAWVPPNCGMVRSGLEEDCVYDPSRIKVLEIIPLNLSNSLSAKTLEGRKYIMYHGTTMENALKIYYEGFKCSSDGMLGRGVYLSRDIEKASRYPEYDKGEQLAILEVEVRVGKVKMIDYQGHPLQKTCYQHDYDTAWVPPDCGMVPSGLEEDCVYDPNRIKVLKIIKNLSNCYKYRPVYSVTYVY
ncbi:grass carp reovirus (GCRV)-induced gene 2q [Garra rufa]|uniref:grass carp reovirus (GCRV)-induced gene 2q n=1 Tax=Garra rufa TaxID=137080 RepID=UPI003CCEC849